MIRDRVYYLAQSNFLRTYFWVAFRLELRFDCNLHMPLSRTLIARYLTLMLWPQVEQALDGRTDDQKRHGRRWAQQLFFFVLSGVFTFGLGHLLDLLMKMVPRTSRFFNFEFLPHSNC